ncbi:MAG TPA: hypothetical protein VNO52_09600 [Methylomirabilota bacterium]|nr:hypothetical protein [Methylomirabilota bacterium]
MRPVAIVLGLLCAVLAFALFKRNSTAAARAEADLNSIQSLSNQVAELKTRLALAQGTASQTQSNLQAQLDRRMAETVALSNQLDRLQRHLAQTQREHAAALAEIGLKATELASLLAERDELKRQLDGFATLRREMTDLREEARRLIEARNEFERRLGETRVQLATLESRLADTAFLRARLQQAEDAEKVRKRLAASKPVGADDSRVRLELRPDGSVHAALPAAASPQP